ncbi:hypothetical protein GCK32_022230 [Trichostrongylus colubriformis]|uniref:Uncharacterized protein n=1 Tax=Trichostrongylus colubriformis TaxID=6319 RepID=A0AAN8FZ05_TRICO
MFSENVYDSCDLNNSTQWKSRHFSLNHRIPTTSQTQVVEKKCISKDHTPSINPFIVPRALQLFGDSVSLSEIACRLNQVEFLRKHHPSRNHLPSHHLA